MIHRIIFRALRAPKTCARARLDPGPSGPLSAKNDPQDHFSGAPSPWTHSGEPARKQQQTICACNLKGAKRASGHKKNDGQPENEFIHFLVCPAVFRCAPCSTAWPAKLACPEAVDCVLQATAGSCCLSKSCNIRHCRVQGGAPLPGGVWGKAPSFLYPSNFLFRPEERRPRLLEDAYFFIPARQIRFRAFRGCRRRDPRRGSPRAGRWRGWRPPALP